MPSVRDGEHEPGAEGAGEDLDTDDALRECLALVAAMRADVAAMRVAVAARSGRKHGISR